jgi:hypothetical protein
VPHKTRQIGRSTLAQPQTSAKLATRNIMGDASIE